MIRGCGSTIVRVPRRAATVRCWTLATSPQSAARWLDAFGFGVTHVGFARPKCCLQHDLRGLQRAFHPGLIRRVGLAADVTGKIGDRLRHLLEHLPRLVAAVPEVHAAPVRIHRPVHVGRVERRRRVLDVVHLRDLAVHLHHHFMRRPMIAPVLCEGDRANDRRGSQARTSHAARTSAPAATTFRKCCNRALHAAVRRRSRRATGPRR